MYCKKLKEFVEYNSCEDCMEDNPEKEDCEYFIEKKARDEKIIKLKDSKFIKEVFKNLSNIIDLPKETLLDLLDNFSKDICNISTEYIKKTIISQTEIMCQNYIESKLKAQLDTVFKQVLVSEIAVLQKDDKFITTSIQEKLLQKTNDFFQDKQNYRNRDVKDDLNDIIAETVNNKCDEALKELKKETIDKFNKEAMKTMMKGMAKQLGSDKRLMRILTSEDF